MSPVLSYHCKNLAITESFGYYSETKQQQEGVGDCLLLLRRMLRSRQRCNSIKPQINSSNNRCKWSNNNSNNT